MATLLRSSMTDHSLLDDTGDDINGSEVDENSYVISDVLDGTTQTDLASANRVDFLSTSTHSTSREAIRLIDLDAGAAAVHDVLRLEWDPASGSPTNGQGIGIVWYLSDSVGNQDEVASLDVVSTDVTATSEDYRIDFSVITAGTLASELQLSGASLNPTTNDGLALGTTSLGFADLHLATGGVINWANGEVTITETDANTLTVAGISTLALPSSVVLNFASSDVTLTHSTGLLTFAGTGIVLGDDDTIGLGSGKATIEFDDQATDEINFLNCRIGIGTSTPTNLVDIGGGSALGTTLSVRGATGPLCSFEATATTSALLDLVFVGISPDNNTSGFLRCQDSTTTRLQIWSDGDVQNHDNSYGALSDAALKQDITAARDYWEDFKQIQFRKYRFISDVEADPNAGYQIGVVAQELENVFPGLIQTDPDSGMKGVKYSVLDVIACKVLQECIERIEALEAAA